MTETVSDLRERKLEKNFTLLDLDNDGVIDESDMNAIVRRICEQVGRDISSPEHRGMIDSLNGFWQSLDRDNSGSLSRDEYVQAMLRVADEPGELERLIMPSHLAFFNLVDTDGDGLINRREFDAVYTAAGLTDEERSEAFDRMDLDGDGMLAADELAQSAIDFYRSEDPAAPANWINGFF